MTSQLKVAVHDPGAVESYNYANFGADGGSDFLAFRTALPVGSKAPDPPVIPLDGTGPVPLSSYWASGDVLMEFGSLT